MDFVSKRGKSLTHNTIMASDLITIHKIKINFKEGEIYD